MLNLLLGQVLVQSETTGLRSEGKIYVVIIVVGLIFLGISMYLISIDLRLRKIEKKD
jgi:hypothetical protein